jgi:uncharacterized protein
VYGHTHIPQVESYLDVLILNPGSPTERRRAPAHTMIELEVNDTKLGAELVRVG